MFIKKIVWLNQEVQEAELYVSAGIKSIICFSHPCQYSENDQLFENLEILDVSDIRLSDEDVYCFERVGDTFEYLVTGRLENDRSVLVVGEFKINIPTNEIPGDLQDGMFIKVRISRIDVW